ncbi:hypothetical protein J7K76_07405 [Candidatus Bipolaricaulota bacterium]|nr:hypothetical protein [Candidatus Bipolaricaulota bacterium]
MRRYGKPRKTKPVASGFIPDVMEGFIPDVMEGFIPDVMEGFIPDVNGVYPDVIRETSQTSCDATRNNGIGGKPNP